MTSDRVLARLTDSPGARRTGNGFAAGEHDFVRDDVVRVHGERGVFRFKSYHTDGSCLLWGGPSGCESYRSVMVERVRRARGNGPERNPGMAAHAGRRAGSR